MKECQQVTKAIRNVGKVLIYKLLAVNVNCSRLKINRFKIPHYA